MAEKQLGVDPSNAADAINKGWLQTYYTPNSYASFIGDGASTTVTVTHNLGSRNVLVQLYDAATFAQVSCDVSRPTINTVALLFATAPAASAYVAVVSGGTTVSAITSANITDASSGGLSILTGTNVTPNVTMTEHFDKGVLSENTTLPASNDWVAQQAVEVGASSTLEIPATSSLEIYTYSETGLRSYVDSKFSGAQQAYVAAIESTASGSYIDLTTTTDQVTVNVGSSGMVLVSIRCRTTPTTANIGWMSFVMSGANTQTASEDYSVGYGNNAGGGLGDLGASYFLTGLTPGSTTFKAKYSVNGSTISFGMRRISVIPL